MRRAVFMGARRPRLGSQGSQLLSGSQRPGPACTLEFSCALWVTGRQLNAVHVEMTQITKHPLWCDGQKEDSLFNTGPTSRASSEYWEMGSHLSR